MRLEKESVALPVDGHRVDEGAVSQLPVDVEAASVVTTSSARPLAGVSHAARPVSVRLSDSIPSRSSVVATDELPLMVDQRDDGGA